MDAFEENLLTLVAATGISKEEAAQRLLVRVHISHDDSGFQRQLAGDIAELLSRTLTVTQNASVCDIEVCLGAERKTSAQKCVLVEISSGSLSMTRMREGAVPDRARNRIAIHGLLRKIAACYIAGHAIAATLSGVKGEGVDFDELPDEFNLRFADLGVSIAELRDEIQLQDTVLIGGGGVANGFLWAASELWLSGSLAIVDPKRVSPGNANRCLYFDTNDAGQYKASLLAARVKLDECVLEPFVGSFSDYLKTRPGNKASTVIVTVDSRPARRTIQSELPAAVLDASTTDISEVIVHSHSVPTEGACLSCIYSHDSDEDQQARHLAETLGLDLSEVRQPLITAAIAEKLCRNFSLANPEELVGTAFDSFYKARCGEGRLFTPTGKQAAAPFAFVSNLAGALLALELVRFQSNRASVSRENYFFSSPWKAPHRRLRRRRPRLPGCEFCGSHHASLALKATWPERFASD